MLSKGSFDHFVCASDIQRRIDLGFLNRKALCGPHQIPRVDERRKSFHQRATLDSSSGQDLLRGLPRAQQEDVEYHQGNDTQKEEYCGKTDEKEEDDQERAPKSYMVLPFSCH